MGRKIVLVGVLAGVAWGLSRPVHTTPVMLVTAERKDMNLLAQSVGSVQASQSVVIRPLAPGQISEITFQEGQEVKKGDVLARIDASLYHAQLAQAQANKQQDEAQGESLRFQLRTLGSSKTPNAKQQALITAIHQSDAAVKSDIAAIQQAQALVDYTTITAPMDGRLGIKRIDAGNIIQPGDTNGLVEITQMDPVMVVFTLPERNLPGLSSLLAKNKPITVTARDIATGAPLAEGTLELADNQVNQNTGALLLKASFDNASRRLWPGAMVNVQISLGTLPAALVVPQAALIRRGEQHYVYKVDDNQKTVTLRPVKLLLVQGDEAAIAEGIAPGDQLAVESPMLLANDKAAKELSNISPAR